MKKLVILLLPFLLLCGCGKSSYKEISFDTFEKLVENKESFILFIGAESCSHCVTYKTTINEVVKEYKVDIKYIDVDKLSTKQDSALKKVASYTGTPTTVFIEKGKEESTYNRIVGNRDFEYVINKLQKNGYIKKVK